MITFRDITIQESMYHSHAIHHKNEADRHQQFADAAEKIDGKAYKRHKRLATAHQDAYKAMRDLDDAYHGG